MKILLSNDDGYQAKGLNILLDAVREIAEVVVVAPESNCSGFSNALTLRKPIKVRSHHNGVYSVQGTPADCVHLAVNGMLEFEPDLVISGINNGPNLGDDAMYSGTVAAAVEGRFLRLPALAVSLAGEQLMHFDSAVKVVMDLLQRLIKSPPNNDCLLNINVPDLPYDELNGIEVTRCGKRNHSEPVSRHPSEDGSHIYRIGRPGKPEDCGPGTDFFAIAQQKISITPLTIDMTHHKNIEFVSHWLRA